MRRTITTIGGLVAAVLLAIILWRGDHGRKPLPPERPAVATIAGELGGRTFPNPAAGVRRRGAEGFRQLPTAVVRLAALNLPTDLPPDARRGPPPREIPGRRVPPLLPAAEFGTGSLARFAVPLPEANTLGHVHFAERSFGRLQAPDGGMALFNPEVVLVKPAGEGLVAAVRVESGQELAALRALARRPDVAFAELDVLQRRASVPNDPLVTNQWHHQTIGSFSAWNRCLGSQAVRIAIVDTPFQMDHPDLAANVAAGWDAVLNAPVTGATGIVHSTMCAGMAAAVINNHLGVAGAGNCTILPININGFISEMCDAVYWAASNDVRVVSISWDGAYSDALNAAGSWLRTTGGGLLAMAGVNGSGFLNYTNQPDIWCVSMTDAADNLQSCYGPHIDFAAPGWNVLATTTGGGYATGSGTSYATPLFAGVIAVLFSLNPTLGPEDVIGLLQSTAVDKYGPGWNMFFGWGRIDFGAAADAAYATLPVLTGLTTTNGQVLVSAQCGPGLNCTLWRSPALDGGWTLVSNAVVTVNGGVVSLVDPRPVAPRAFYRVQASRP